MKSKKILMASLVPFWHRQTGAQQRMFALVQALQSTQHQVKTFFPSSEFTSDQDLIKQYSLDVEQPTSDQPPDGVIPKATWYFRAVFNQLLTLLQTLPYPTRRLAERTAGMNWMITSGRGQGWRLNKPLKTIDPTSSSVST